MADYSDLVTATRAVVDPSTSAADLAQIAQVQPGLRAQIATHPNVYPGLLQWMAAQGDASAPAPLAPVAAPQFPSPVAPQMPLSAAFPQASSLMPGVRHSNRPLVITIVALVVVAVTAALLIWRPWQSSSRASGSGPTLTMDQFVWMIGNEPSVSLGFQTEGDITNAVNNGPSAAGFQDLATAVDSGGFTESSQACAVADGWPAAEQGFLGGAWPGDGPTNDTLVSGGWLFDTAQHAGDVITQFAACGDDSSNGYDKISPIAIDGVMLWGYDISVAHGNFDLGFAQYGNVIFVTDDADYQRTWADWQAQARTMKQAVDQAASH